MPHITSLHFHAATNVRATFFMMLDIFTDVNIATNEHNAAERFVLLIKGLAKNKIYGKLSSVTVMKR